jgi:hypothetical protein
LPEPDEKYFELDTELQKGDRTELACVVAEGRGSDLYLKVVVFSKDIAGERDSRTEGSTASQEVDCA